MTYTVYLDDKEYTVEFHAFEDCYEGQELSLFIEDVQAWDKETGAEVTDDDVLDRIADLIIDKLESER